MATYLWSAIANGDNIVFNKASDVLSFNNANLSASNVLVGWGSGTKVTFTTVVNGVKKEFTLDVVGAGKGLTTTNVTFQNNSLLYIGDNATGTANDNLGHSFLGHNTAGDRFLLLGGDDTMNGRGGDDTFVLNNGSGNFGADSVVGGTGSDWIGVGFALNTPSGSTVNFNTGSLTTTTAYGSATFSGVENAFGTIHNDSFFAYQASRTLTGMQTGANADFSRTMEGYSGADHFRGDSRDGYFEIVRYTNAPSGVKVNLAEGTAQDGYDSDSVTAGVQSYNDTLIAIDAVQGSSFNDSLLGGGHQAYTYSGVIFESFEGMKGNDTISANGDPFLRADYQNSPAAVFIDLAKGTAQDGWGTTDTLIGISIVRGSNFNDTMIGNGFNNQFEGRAGNDSIDGGDGLDVVVFQNATAGIVATLAESGVTTLNATMAGLGIDKLTSIEGLRGGDYNDSLTGNSLANTLEGRSGADTLKGMGGVDLVRYDASLGAVVVNLASNTAQDGNDSDFGTGGIQSYIDTLQSIENVRGSKFNDTLTGNTGDNTIEGWAGNDQLNGGDGIDALEFFSSPEGVVASLAAVSYDGWGGSDVVAGFEKLFGSNFDDSLTGDAGENDLDGRAGVDTLTGGDGDDIYVVDDIEDQVVEAGDYDGGIDDVYASVSYRLGGSTEGLRLQGSANLNGRGNELANFIQGNSGSNHLWGLAGTDNLDGLAGNDTLDGGADVDIMTGGAGADVFIWDAADSSVDGGAGFRDKLVVTGSGHSLDLTAVAGDAVLGMEIIDLRGTGNNSVTLDAASIAALPTAGSISVYVTGNAGDEVDLPGTEGWVKIAPEEGQSYYYGNRPVDWYMNTANGIRLIVDEAVTVNIPT